MLSVSGTASDHRSNNFAKPRLRKRLGRALGRFHERTYARLAGSLPELRPWHFQWLIAHPVSKELHAILPGLGGRVLDVGCGDKPYERWMPRAEEYVGLDVFAGPAVDVMVDPDSRWPLPEESFDVVVCFQVLEHVRDLDLMLSEIERVLRPGGTLVVAVPFIYNEHAAPHDYRRLSRDGVALVLAERFRLREVRTQGGVGSTVGMTLLNWVALAMTRRPERVLALLALLPVWLLLTSAVNLIGFVLDRLDRTGAFYGNVVAVASKPSTSSHRSTTASSECSRAT